MYLSAVVYTITYFKKNLTKKKNLGNLTELYSTWNLFPWIFRHIILITKKDNIDSFFLYVISFYDLNFFICKMEIK